MNLEQTTATVLDKLAPFKRSYKFENMPTACIEIAVQMAWTAGRNYGYTMGANDVLEKVDESLARGPLSGRLAGA